MGEIAGEEDEIRLRIESVDDIDRALECLGAGRIRRSLESDVRVAELDEVERRQLFAVLPSKPAPERCGRTAAGHGGSDRDQRSDAEGHAGDFEEFTSIEGFAHAGRTGGG